MSVILAIIWFIVFVKLLLFWLWLWQLKEYHWKRFLAHFETQAVKKVISSFWRVKYPKFTLKITVIFFFSLFAEFLLAFYFQVFWALLLTFVLIPAVFFFFQIAAIIWRKGVIDKAKAKRAEFKNLLVIGITGSYGKTSTKEFLASILQEKFDENEVLKTKEHQNSEIGISRSILNDLKPEHKIFVAEMAAYSKGGIKLLADIIKPSIGIVTGVNEQHLSTFGSMENLLSAEGGRELIESLPETGTAFFNAKNKYCVELWQKTKIEKYLYGKEAKNFAMENWSGAKAVAKKFGITEKQAAKAVKKIKNKLPGMEIKEGIKGTAIIDASYSANPTGVIAHLEYLKKFPEKKIIIMPCLIELGSQSIQIHKNIGQKIARICDLAIITTGDKFNQIREGFILAGGKKENILLIENYNDIFEKIKSFSKQGDAVLLEGRTPNNLIKKLYRETLTKDTTDNSFKPVSISLSPNIEKDDISLALALMLKKISKEEKLRKKSLFEEALKKYLKVKNIFLFNSARSAFFVLLQAFQFQKGDEVLLQSFTCNAAVNPVIWQGLKPVYVDCDERTFNIDIADLEKKITKRSRAVMIQHTFGLPADIEKVVKICRKNSLILIEDCAHALGAKYKRKKVGTFGQAAFFSFSRDKVISSVYGGALVANDANLAAKIMKYTEKIEYPSWFWIYQQLLHPVLLNWLILPTYKIFGKYFLIISQQLHILSKAVHWKEKRGKKPDYFPKKFPATLAVLALNQFEKIEKFNRHRKEIAKFYRQELKNSSFQLPAETEQIYLRFTLKHPEARKIINNAWRNNLLIGDWYDSPVAPSDTKLDKMGYIPGSCKIAEKLSSETLNLPTHINISKKDAQKIVDFLKQWK